MPGTVRAVLSWFDGTSRQTYFEILKIYNIRIDIQKHIADTKPIKTFLNVEWSVFQFGLSIMLELMRIPLFLSTF